MSACGSKIVNRFSSKSDSGREDKSDHCSVFANVASTNTIFYFVSVWAAVSFKPFDFELISATDSVRHVLHGGNNHGNFCFYVGTL